MIRKYFGREFLVMLGVSISVFVLYGYYVYFFGIPKTYAENYEKQDICRELNLLNRVYCKI